VHLLFANRVLEGIVGICMKNFKARNRQYWDFIRIIFGLSVNKNMIKCAQNVIIPTTLIRLVVHFKCESAVSIMVRGLSSQSISVIPVAVSFTMLAIFKDPLRDGFYRRIFCTQCQLYKLQISLLVLKLKKNIP
jgi:hypothetical protein